MSEEEPTKVTLYADGEPYQVLDLKDIGDMSEEEYNDKLKDAWFKKTHYETIEELKELTLSKYYNYEVEEEGKETKNDKSIGFTGEILCVVLTLLFVGVLIGILIFAVFKIVNGG